MKIQLRTLRFWIRAIPRKGVGKPTKVYHRIYRTKRAALAAKRPGDVVADAKAFIWSQH
jgi:hypothetical protein